MTCPWMSLVASLAQWAFRLITRRDVYGKYVPTDRRTDLKKIAFMEKAEPTEDVLSAHFAGQSVIGLFVLAIDGSCRVVVIDIDRHGEEGDANANEKAAITLFDRAVGQGCSAFLEDSNGCGGYKLWLIFEEPVPASWARQFARRLVEDWKDLGLEKQPEIFPKQDTLKPGKFGNFVRLPGRHHTLDFWSRIWDGTGWREGEDAARVILATRGSLATSLSEELRCDKTLPSGSSAKTTPGKANARPIPIWLVRSASEALPTSFFTSYEIWLNLGMSLLGLGDEGLRLWEEASRNKCPKYRAGACGEKWVTFTLQPGGLTYRSLFRWAMQFGWSPRGRKKSGRAITPAPTRAEQVENPVVQSDMKPNQPAPTSGHDGDGGQAPNGGTTPDEGGQPPDANAAQSASGGIPKRPQILWEDRPPPDVTDEALAAYKATASQKRLFVKGGALVRLRRTEEGPRTEELS